MKIESIQSIFLALKTIQNAHKKEKYISTLYRVVSTLYSLYIDLRIMDIDFISTLYRLYYLRPFKSSQLCDQSRTFKREDKKKLI